MTESDPSNGSLRLTHSYKTVRGLLLELKEFMASSCLLALEGKGRKATAAFLSQIHYGKTITRLSGHIDH